MVLTVCPSLELFISYLVVQLIIFLIHHRRGNQIGVINIFISVSKDMKVTFTRDTVLLLNE